MTLSKDTRRRERAELLAGILARVGDGQACERPIFVVGRDFPGIEHQAWMDLGGLVERRKITGDPQYRLTVEGWYTATAEIVGIRSPQIFERARKLMQLLKQCADAADPQVGKQRLDDPFGAAVGLPDGWTLNALRSRLLWELFPRDNINHSWDEKHQCFRVPMNWGRKLL